MGVSQNLIWYLFFNFSRLGLLFLVNIWISRVLGPVAFGEFSYLLSITLYIASIDAFSHESVIKQLLATNSDKGETLGTATVLNLGLLIVSLVLVFGILQTSLVTGSLGIIFLLFIPVHFGKLTNPIAQLFDVNLLSKYASFALFFGAVISSLVRVYFAQVNGQIEYQSAGYSLQALGTSLALVALYFYYFKKNTWSFSKTLLIEILKKSGPIFVSTILYLSISVSDIFMIQHMFGSKEVGIYSVVVKLCEPWVIVSSAISAAFFPLIFKAQNSDKRTNKYFITALQLSIYFVFVLGIVLNLLIEPLIVHLLGDSYSSAIPVFKIYYWGILFLFVSNIQHVWEVLKGLYSISIYKTASTCLLKIVLNFSLGSIYGIKGFAIASVISLFYYGVGFNLISTKTRYFLQLQLSSLKYDEVYKRYRWMRSKGRLWFRKKY